MSDLSDKYTDSDVIIPNQVTNLTDMDEIEEDTDEPCEDISVFLDMSDEELGKLTYEEFETMCLLMD